MEITLPDCTPLDLGLDLTPEEEERLLQEVARDGRKGLDRFSSSYGKDHSSDGFGDRLKQYRERLEEQATRVLDDRRGGFEQDSDERLLRRSQELEDLRQQRPHIIPDMDRVNVFDLESLMQKDDLLALINDLPPLTLLERIQSLILRLKVFFYRMYLRLRRMTWGRIGKKGKRSGLDGQGRHKQKVSLALFGGRTKFSIGVPVSKLLMRPRFRKRVLAELREGGKGTSGKIEDLTEEILRQHVEAAMQRKLREERANDEERIRDHEHQEETLSEEIDKENRETELHNQEELTKLRERLRERTEDPVGNLVERHLLELGFIERAGEKVIPTTALLERFADLIFQKELNALPGTGARRGHSERKLGIYEKAKMRSVYEESRMDIVSTLVNTRINHPGDRHIEPEDIIVYREESAISTHVVIMFDKSSSMEENQRMEAAKRTVMALYRAVKREREKDRIDILGFDTRVSLMDLMAVWDAEPRGFTNIGGALRNARLLFGDSRADVKIAYLITDGLPEAYTDEDGREMAGELEVCLEYALKEAANLDASLTMILLEPKEESYIEAGRAIVEQAGGKLITTNPKDLMHEVLSDYLG